MKNYSDLIHIGTCSWKYPSWKGILYSNQVGKRYLSEYARHYNTVEVDQWFWSLFPGNKVVLPKPEVVAEYISSVPESFKFSVKVPNAITLTHHYSTHKKESLIENPFFLSNEVFDTFLRLIHLMRDQLAALIFQFGYLNKQKMPGQQIFQERLLTFFANCPPDIPYCIEIRNPNYLNQSYFNFLNASNLYHVFLQGYYMPSIFDLYGKYQHFIQHFTLIRLLGPNRQGIEEKSQGIWNKLFEPKEEELDRLAKMMHDLMIKKIRLMVNVNNHYEGSAPLTIKRLLVRL